MGVTSGNFLTSDSGQGGGNYYGRLIFEWWEVNSGISGSVGYHGINYHLKTYGGSGSYYQWLYNCSMNVDGAGYGRGNGPAYGGGQVVLGDYGNTLYTNSSGDRGFGASAQGGIYYNTINTSGSGNWTFNRINLWGGVTDIHGDGSALSDEAPYISVTWFHYTGTPHLWFRFNDIDSGDTTYHIVNPSNPYVWTGFQSWAQSKMTNVNSSTLDIYYGDDIDNNGSVDNWQGPWAYTMIIKNDVGQANPTFPDFTYVDTNTTTPVAGGTVGITGNNQVLIQRYSTLEATISVANKATALKQATMNNYVFTIGGYNQVSAWSSGSNVVKTIGTISDVSGTQNLSVRAVDSRTNSTSVTKSVTILPYDSPSFVPTLTLKYANNYDTSSGLTVTANGTNIANISPMTLSGTDKNAVNTTTGVKFDLSKNNNTSYTGSPVNVTITQTSGTGAINTTLSTLATAILTKMNAMTADNTVRWYIKFQVTDKLETQYFETSLDIGRSIFRIGADANVYFNEVAYQSINSITSSATPTPVGSAAMNQYFVTALGTGATFAAPTGTLTNGNRLMIRIKDDGTSRTLAWNSVYRTIGAVLPTATTAGKTIYVGCVYNDAASKWDCMAVNTET